MELWGVVVSGLFSVVVLLLGILLNRLGKLEIGVQSLNNRVLKEYPDKADCLQHRNECADRFSNLFQRVGDLEKGRG